MKGFSNGTGPFLKPILPGLAALVAAACGTGNVERNIMEADEERGTWEERVFVVSVTVPDPAWEVAIEEIRVAGEEVRVISRLSRNPELMAPQVISEASDRVEAVAPDYPERHYLLGKTWAWDGRDAPDNYTFAEDRSDLAGELRAGERIFPRE